MHRDHEHEHEHEHNQRFHEGDIGPGKSCPGRKSGVSDSVGFSNGKPRNSRSATQWQMPHLDAGQPERKHEDLDLDQVEAAFVEGFMTSNDPTSFLRLVNIPLQMTNADGAKLVLLRVETDLVADIGSLTPHLGGESFRYDPLPRSLVSHRRRLRFIYFDGLALRALNFAQLRELSNEACGQT
jgi:hypothetical protein